MSEILIPLTTNMSDGELEQLELFQNRFYELWNNWESLKEQGIELGGSFTRLGNNNIEGASCGIEIHRLKGFYLDFRFFYAQKEPTYFFRITSMLGKHCTDSRLSTYLKNSNHQWENVNIAQEWHGIKSDELIDTLFNGNLFHSDSTKRTRIKEIHKLMSNVLLHHFLVYCIYSRMLVIRNINWMIMPLNTQSQVIRLPH